MLRALGVTGRAIPPEVEERQALYRSILADQATLLVVDDAATEEQVEMLLPGAACGVLITSRRALVGIPGVHSPLSTSSTRTTGWRW